jgi:hypothetical protein
MATPFPVQVDDFLGSETHRAVLDLLGSPNLCWKLQRRLDRASRGQTLQLASQLDHDTSEMIRLSRLLAGAAFDALATLMPPADAMSPQIFPVVMTGSREDPPLQQPHRDTHLRDGHAFHPVWTSVYYPVVQGLCGGDLVGIDVSDGQLVSSFRHSPKPNQLVAFPGDTIHWVEPLWEGRRTSVVINFFALS